MGGKAVANLSRDQICSMVRHDEQHQGLSGLGMLNGASAAFVDARNLSDARLDFREADARASDFQKGSRAALDPKKSFFILARQTGDSRWLGGAFFVGLINLINLAPAPPLDGSKALGPALARIHPLVEKVALVLVGIVAVILAVRTGNWIIGAFVGVATLGALRAQTLRAPARPLSAAEWMATVALWLIALALCVGVIAFASVGAGRLS